MMLFAMSEESGAGIGGVLTFFYVVLVLAILFLVRSLDLKLIALGLLTAVLATWWAFLTGGIGAGIQVGPGPAGAVGRFTLAGDAAGTLGRVAVLLILGGLVSAAVGRWNSLTPPVNREGTRRDDSV